MPNAALIGTAPLIRLLASRVPYRECGTATVSLKLESSLDLACAVLECTPSFLVVQAPSLTHFGAYSLTVIAGDISVTVDRAITVHETSWGLVGVAPSLLFLQPGETTAPISVRFRRDALPPIDLSIITATLVFASTHAADQLVCEPHGFSDVAGYPELVALASACAVPADAMCPSAKSGVPLSLIVTLSVPGSERGVYQLDDSLSVMAPFGVTRVDPSPAVAATTQEPRTLSLLLGDRGGSGFFFLGVGPVRVRVLPASGSVTVDDAATVVSEGSLSFTYTSDSAALGPAALAVGALDAAGVFVPMFELPALLTVVAALPPLPQRVLAVYPPLLDLRAFGAGAVVAVHVEGGVPPTAAVTLGAASVEVAETGGHGLVLRLLAPPSLLNTLLSLVIRDTATGVVLAHAPALFQTAALGGCVAFDIFPPVLAAEQNEPARTRVFTVRGLSIDAIDTCVVWHRGVAHQPDLSRFHEPSSGELMMVVQLVFQLQPGAPVTLDCFASDALSIDAAAIAALPSRAAGGRRRLLSTNERILTLELPVVDPRVRTLTPASVVCTAISKPCSFVFTAGFDSDVGPFPLHLTVLIGAVTVFSTENVMHPDGTLSAAVALPGGQPVSSLAVNVAVRDLYRQDLKTGILAELSLDVLYFSKQPRIENVFPATASVYSRPTNVLFFTSGILARGDAFTLHVGPYRARVTAHGSFFLMADVRPSEGPIAPAAYDVELQYREQVVAAEAAAFTFLAESASIDSILPLWVLASSDAAEFRLTGAGLREAALVRLVASATVQYETTHIRLSTDGRSLTFIVALDAPGVFTVLILNSSGGVVATTGVVAIEHPVLKFLQPNGTISLGPEPAPERGAASGSRTLAALVLTLEADSTLLRVPAQFFAVFESDGTAASGIAITHKSVSGTAAVLTIRQEGGEILAADYRLCFRSLVEADVMVTTREIPGTRAVLTFDYDEFVPKVLQVNPQYLHSAVVFASDSHYRKIVLSLENANGNLPGPAQLRAVIGGQPAPVVTVGSNYIVLLFENTDVSRGEPLDIGVYDTLSERSVLSFSGSESIVISGGVSDEFQPLGLSTPCVYVPDGGIIPVRIDGLAGISAITRILVGWEECAITALSPTFAECQFDVGLLTPGTHFARVGTTTAQTIGQGIFTLTLIPRITVMVANVTHLARDAAHVILTYQCALDLSIVPVAPRLAGVSADISDVSITPTSISFVATRLAGPVNAAVELYDVTFDSGMFLVTLNARVSFPRDPIPWFYWVAGFGLLAAVATAATAAVAVKRGCICNSTEDGEDDAEFEYDSLSGAPAQGDESH